MELEEQLLRGRQFQNELSNTAGNSSTGGLSKIIATFRSRRQANRNADLTEALKLKKQKERSDLIGTFEPEQRELAEQLSDNQLKKLMSRRLELDFEAQQPLSAEGKRQADIKGGRLDTSKELDFQRQLVSQKEQSKVIGKQTGTDIDKLATIESSLPELNERVKKLSEIGQKASFTFAQISRDFFSRQVKGKATEGSIARKQYISKLDQTVLPLLKQTFTGTTTDTELNALRNTLGNANLAPAEKDAVLQGFIQEQMDKSSSLRRKLGLPPIQFNAPKLGQPQAQTPQTATQRAKTIQREQQQAEPSIEEINAELKRRGG